MVSVSSAGTAAVAPAPPAVSRTRRAGRALLLLALPAVIVLGVFFVVPAIRLAWLSVSTPELGIGNYTGLATDGVVVTVVLRTLGMAAVVTVLCVLCAYPYAYLMTIVGPRWRAVLTALVLLPFWTSLMARTFAWVVLLQDTGVVNALLAAVGLGPTRLLGTTAGVSIAMAQVMLPFMVLPVYAAMRGIDRRLVDAAMGLGARPINAFLRVYLPLSLRGVAAGATLVMVLSLGFYVTPSLVGSPQQSMLAQLISVQVNQLLNFGAAGALAVTLLVVTLVLVAGVQRLTRTGGAPAALVGGTAS
ncbi:putative spermidine/putrescine transport system permease protein [Pseudonocardia hierapolitana]|uniref:Putative spermidine/putrescine transport system permease protein n=1 Tax=Pseudonocardia hierapolitana TaxID=1128676 RepID=A0A561T4B3_9PSEU|nr:ABC transporter permease [Pseudonocardia hierapolitana]TWF81960.1 putative spermidine/putrescine transport system permease protein [Pseudonocardia hierapolitana]